MINLLQTISSIDISSGGPAQSVWSLITGLRNLEIETKIVTYKSKNNRKRMIGEGSFIYAIPSPSFNRFGFSNLLNNFFKNNTYDIYHGHGLWQYPVHVMAKTARYKSKPYIISPRGMLYEEAMHKSAWIKKIALAIYQHTDLKNATVLHATCNEEYEQIRNLGLKNPVAIIPNSIDILIPPKQAKQNNQKKQVGFIGRFAPIKNIEYLIKAWAETGKNNSDWELVLIGDGDSAYKTRLLHLVKKLNIKNISFPGFLTGDDKEKALQSLNYLVLPSKSENFGMVVPEALIRGIPVIASKGTPWHELNSYDAGWWIDIGIQPLVNTIQKAIQLPEKQRQQMGKNGRKLVEKKYSIETVASQMLQLYKWVLKQDTKPSFVRLH